MTSNHPAGQPRQSYLLLTPIKNEAENLPLLAELLMAQTALPALWLIVNDASTDNSQTLVDALQAQHPWICSLRLPFEQGGLGLHYARVVAQGFTALQAEAERRHISYDLIGKLDADVLFGPACFAELLAAFAAEERLGIASPGLTNLQVDKNGQQRPAKKEVVLGDHPTDGIRLFRRACYEEIGGSPVVRAPETVAEAKAVLRGWKLRRCAEITAYHRRKTHPATTLWQRWEMAGSEQQYLGYHPVLVLGHAGYELIFRSPKYLFLAYLIGYLKGVAGRQEKIQDEEVRAYFGRQRLREIWPQVPALLKEAFRR